MAFHSLVVQTLSALVMHFKQSLISRTNIQMESSDSLMAFVFVFISKHTIYEPFSVQKPMPTETRLKIYYQKRNKILFSL